MDEKLKNEWIAALRSGEYKQGRGKLHKEVKSSTPNWPEGDYFCCLGVLCEVADGLERDKGGYRGSNCWMEVSLHSDLIERYGLDRRVAYEGEAVNLETKLISLNDDREWNFNQIADYLERVNF